MKNLILLQHPLSPLKGVMVSIALISVLGASTLVRSAHGCWCDPIIFDPQNFAQRASQVQQLIGQLAEAKTQVLNQLKSLANLSGASTVNVTQQMQSLQSALPQDDYGDNPADSTLESAYPRQMDNLTHADYQALQRSWSQGYRAMLTENRQLQNIVAQQMPETTAQVQQIVTASNDAPGEKAAVQAHNELIATLSGQLTALQALRVARLRAHTEKRARLQSEAAYGQSQGQAVLAGMAVPSARTTPLTSVWMEP